MFTKLSLSGKKSLVLNSVSEVTSLRDEIFSRESSAFDSNFEKRATKWLRSLSSDECLKVLFELVPQNELLAQRLINRCVSDYNALKLLLEEGLKKSDASGISSWLEVFGRKLGKKKLLLLARELCRKNPEIKCKTAWWIEGLHEDT